MWSECPLVKVWSLGLVPKYCYRCLFTVLLHLYCPQYYHHQPHFSGAVTTAYTFIPPVFHYLFAELVHLLGVLGTQETSCFVVAGLHERDIFDLFLPEIDKPWVIHLRETCCCSTNLCSWRPNTVYKNRSSRRHQWTTLSMKWLQWGGRDHSISGTTRLPDEYMVLDVIGMIWCGWRWRRWSSSSRIVRGLEVQLGCFGMVIVVSWRWQWAWDVPLGGLGGESEGLGVFSKACGALEVVNRKMNPHPPI